MLETPIKTHPELVPYDMGSGHTVRTALENGWVTYDTGDESANGATTVTVTHDPHETVDDQMVDLEVSRSLEQELFEWSVVNKGLSSLFEQGPPEQWFTLRAEETVTQIINYSKRTLSDTDIEEIRKAHARTSEVTGGASTLGTKAIVIVDQEFLGMNRSENRPSNGRAYTGSGVVFLSERIFDPEDESTKEYVRRSGKTQAMAVLAHEEMHEAQLGRYSPVARTGYDHLAEFKSELDWQERTYELTDGSLFTIVGIGNVALEGGGIEMPVSSYGYSKAAEDVAEAGAALVIGVDPGSKRTASVQKINETARRFNPRLANQSFDVIERQVDLPVGASETDYPINPVRVNVRLFEYQLESD